MPRALHLVTLVAGHVLVVLGSAAADAQRTSADTATVFTPTTYTVADFYRNTSFGGASWSADRRRLLVSSNRTGIWNAYTIPVAGGAEQPLTVDDQFHLRAVVLPARRSHPLCDR
jgi:hypothetical protein